MRDNNTPGLDHEHGRMAEAAAGVSPFFVLSVTFVVDLAIHLFLRFVVKNLLQSNLPEADPL